MMLTSSSFRCPHLSSLKISELRDLCGMHRNGTGTPPLHRNREPHNGDPPGRSSPLTSNAVALVPRLSSIPLCRSGSHPDPLQEACAAGGRLPGAAPPDAVGNCEPTTHPRLTPTGPYSPPASVRPVEKTAALPRSSRTVADGRNLTADGWTSRLRPRVSRRGNWSGREDNLRPLGPELKLTSPAPKDFSPHAVTRARTDGRYFPATSFWNLGFLRSGSKLGSIFSHAGET